LKGVAADMDQVAEDVGNIVLANTLPVTPMKTGALRASGRVEVQHTSNGPRALVKFGDSSVNYALQVHENLEAEHWTTPNTGPKYLTRGTYASLDQIKAYFKAMVKKSVKRRLGKK
jgi:hypothetical protein